MTDTIRLREKMEKSGYKYKYIAAKIGLTYPGFLNKINNGTDFKASEIQRLCEILGIELEEKEKIFFAK